MRRDTIAAICTPHGRGGIGIIRISGSQAFLIASRILKIKHDFSQTIINRKLIHGFLVDEDREVLDEVLVAIMPPGKSYTGEPTVEINCHGGKAILSAGLDMVMRAGARMAEPGEFTRQAVINKRLNLIQAEAINELIHARTTKGLKAAWRHYEGGFHQRCQSLKHKLIEVLAMIQALIDFEAEEECYPSIHESILEISQNMKALLQAAGRSVFFRQGCWVALTGAPNSGKSSLFNAILNMERSIVSEQPGTTRDHISESIELEGIEVRITDTAGIRATPDALEEFAINRSKQQIESADIVAYVLDQGVALEDTQIKEIGNSRENFILVLNKSDLPRHKSIENLLENTNMKTFSVSALNKQGIDALVDALSEMIVSKVSECEDPILVNARQSRLLKSASDHAEKAMDLSSNNKRLDLMAWELTAARKCLEEIIGDISDEEILDSIFSRFCVGK